MNSIGIDCRFASGNGGLGTFTRSLVSALLRRDGSSPFVLFVRSRTEVWLQDLPKIRALRILEAPYEQFSLAEQTRFPARIRSSGCSLLYSPSFNVPLFCPVPFIATVHDLILHRFPNEAGFIRRLAYRLVFGRTVKRARSIIAVSETTKADLVRRYPSCRGKVTVSYPGVSNIFVPASESAVDAVRSKYGLQKPFLLYVGNCKQHKNVPLLLESYRKANLGDIELVLVCGGKECNSLSSYEGVKRISDIETRDFPALYSAALGLVTATLDEGFGLPMVEAMACGCPVLATTCGSIPEVCGEHALLVEPTVAALSVGMQRIVNDLALRSEDRLIAARAWVLRYDWNMTADVLLRQTSSCT